MQVQNTMDPPAPTAEHIASVWVTRASPKPKEPQGLSGDDPASPLPTKPIAIHPNRPSTDSNNNDAPRPSGAPAPAAGAPQQLAPAKRTSSANSGGSSRTISDNGAAPQMQAVAAEALLAAAAAAAEAEDARDAAVAGRKGGSSGGHRDVTSSPVVGRERVPRVTSPRRGNRTSNHGNSAGQHALMGQTVRSLSNGNGSRTNPQLNDLNSLLQRSGSGMQMIHGLPGAPGSYMMIPQTTPQMMQSSAAEAAWMYGTGHPTAAGNGRMMMSTNMMMDPTANPFQMMMGGDDPTHTAPAGWPQPLARVSGGSAPPGMRMHMMPGAAGVPRLSGGIGGLPMMGLLGAADAHLSSMLGYNGNSNSSWHMESGALAMGSDDGSGGGARAPSDTAANTHSTKPTDTHTDTNTDTNTHSTVKTTNPSGLDSHPDRIAAAGGAGVGTSDGGDLSAGLGGVVGGAAPAATTLSGGDHDVGLNTKLDNSNGGGVDFVVGEDGSMDVLMRGAKRLSNGNSDGSNKGPRQGRQSAGSTGTPVANLLTNGSMFMQPAFDEQGRLMYPMDHQSVGPLGGSGGGGLGGSTPSWMLPNDPTAMMAQQMSVMGGFGSSLDPLAFPPLHTNNLGAQNSLGLGSHMGMGGLGGMGAGHMGAQGNGMGPSHLGMGGMGGLGGGLSGLGGGLAGMGGGLSGLGGNGVGSRPVGMMLGGDGGMGGDGMQGGAGDGSSRATKRRAVDQQAFNSIHNLTHTNNMMPTTLSLPTSMPASVPATVPAAPAAAASSNSSGGGDLVLPSYNRRIVGRNFYLGRSFMSAIFGPNFKCPIQCTMQLQINGVLEPRLYMVEFVAGSTSWYPRGLPLSLLRGREMCGARWIQPDSGGPLAALQAAASASLQARPRTFVTNANGETVLAHDNEPSRYFDRILVMVFADVQLQQLPAPAAGAAAAGQPGAAPGMHPLLQLPPGFRRPPLGALRPAGRTTSTTAANAITYATFGSGGGSQDGY